jgi:outer membrane lipopolysaccharide assembly protein LptE/RlpB
MKKTITIIALATVAILTGCARHHSNRLDLAQAVDVLLFDQGGQFRTYFA